MHLQIPNALIESLKDVKSFDKEAFVRVHEENEKVTSVRLNDEKIKPAQKNNHPSFIINQHCTPVPWCPDAYYLPSRPSFTFDPLFHAGAYYVQEASSMFLWEMLKQTVGGNTYGARVLDLCAAPGGKSTLLASYFKDGLVVANETIKPRANILVENITKWGSANVVVTINDPRDFSKLEGYFDVMVIDAPCSGSGLFRKDNEAINEWSVENVNLCSLRQQRILADALPALKQGGILIYSTCSYSKEEDESMLDFISSNFQLSSIHCQLNNEWNIVETISSLGAFGYRFFPDKIKGEGFFIAVFRKNDGNEFHISNYSSLVAPSKQERIFVNEWIKRDQGLFLFKQNEKILAISAQWEKDVSLLQKKLYLRRAGVEIGSLKHKDMVPDHALALSLLANESIMKIELDTEDAVKYLQKKELVLGTEAKGWAIATYLDNNLGWIKILHNRVNNYYPSNWRILKD